MNDWVITIPHHISWSTVLKEYEQAENDSSIALNYKISYMPQCRPGDRLFVLYRKQVRGFHFIKNIIDDKKGFTCTTTGQEWPPGIYIQRQGKFHEIKPVKMTGFRGIRPFKYSDKDINMSSDIILSQANRVNGDDIMDSKDDTIVVGEHDEDAQTDEKKETEQNDSQDNGITVIPWNRVGQFMGGKNGLTIVSPDAMAKFPSSVENSIQPGMSAKDGMFDLSELDNILKSASMYEKTLAEKDAKIAELEKQIEAGSDNASDPDGEEEKDKEKDKEKKKEDPEEEEEETDEQKAAKKAEAESATAKSVEAEKKEGKEEEEHSSIDEDIAKVTLGLKYLKGSGSL